MKETLRRGKLRLPLSAFRAAQPCMVGCPVAYGVRCTDNGSSSRRACLQLEAGGEGRAFSKVQLGVNLLEVFYSVFLVMNKFNKMGCPACPCPCLFDLNYNMIKKFKHKRM